jgi:ribosomal small subunit protein bTHX
LGKGDRRSGKGKRFRASYGNTRRKKKKNKKAAKSAKVTKKRAS